MWLFVTRLTVVEIFCFDDELKLSFGGESKHQSCKKLFKK